MKRSCLNESKGIRGMSLDTQLRFHGWRYPAGTQQAGQVRIQLLFSQTTIAGHAQNSQVDGNSFASIHQKSTGVQSNHLSNYCLLNYMNSRIWMTEGIYTDGVSHLWYHDSTLTTIMILKIKLNTTHTKKKNSCKSKCVESKLSSSIRKAHRQQAAKGLLHKRRRTETGFADPVALAQQLSKLHSHFYASIRVLRSTQRYFTVWNLTYAYMQ